MAANGMSLNVVFERVPVYSLHTCEWHESCAWWPLHSL